MITGGELSTENIELMSILLHDGPAVNLTCNYLSLPKTHPKKWKERGCNAIRYTLSQSVDIDVKVLKWIPGMVCNLTIERLNDYIFLNAYEKNEHIMSCSSRFLTLERIEGYTDERIG